MESITLTPTEAVTILNHEMDRVTLEAWIKQGNCPFGNYVKKEGCQRGHYIVWRERLKAYASAQDLKVLAEKIA